MKRLFLGFVATLFLGFAAAQEPAVVPPPTQVRVLGAVVLTYCKQPVALQILLSTPNGADLLTLIAAEDKVEFAMRLAKVYEAAGRGMPAQKVELNPGCLTA